jgi:very-short-patch-repair endonuclease
VEDHLRRDCLTRRNSAKYTHMSNEPTLPRDRARTLRANATEAEQKLWSRLRKRQLDGFQFRRQYAIGPFFVDFICLEAKLVIEVDGSQHADREAQDQSRSAFLRINGYRALRFWNSEVMSDVDSVVERIAEVLRQMPRTGKPER